MVTDDSEEPMKCNSQITRLIKFLLCIPLVFILTGAHIDFSGSSYDESERRRGGGVCVLFVYDLFGGDASIMEQHGAVEWITEPVIEKGILRASGTVTGDLEMYTGDDYVIFNVNEHNKAARVANILRTGSSYSIGNSGALDIHATEWHVEGKYFAISAPFDSSTPEDLDLVVWGKDIETSGIPLVARSIKRQKE